MSRIYNDIVYRNAAFTSVITMKVLVCALAFVALVAVNGHRIPHKPSTRITNGDEVEPHTRPWQVGLIIHEDSGDTSFCGGSLIDHLNVLTSADCLSGNFTQIEVVLGAHNIEQDDATKVVVSSDDILTHEEWRPDWGRNNIGLIRLPSPVTLNENIQPIHLYPSCSYDHVGEDATLTGWGWRSNAEASPVLLEATLTVREYGTCFDYFGSNYNLEDMCAGGAEGKSACVGDYGGPLVIEGEQIGISVRKSLRSPNCDDGWPSAFVRVCYYIDWIETHKER